MNKLENWMDNLKEPALRQALRFVLNSRTDDELVKNIGFIKVQIEEFAKMYSIEGLEPFLPTGSSGSNVSWVTQ